MEHPRVQRLLDGLKDWIERNPEFGKKSELARALGVQPALIQDWIRQRSTPNAHHAFALLDFLAKEKRKARRKRKDDPAPAH